MSFAIKAYKVALVLSIYHLEVINQLKNQAPSESLDSMPVL